MMNKIRGLLFWLSGLFGGIAVILLLFTIVDFKADFAHIGGVISAIVLSILFLAAGLSEK